MPRESGESELASVMKIAVTADAEHNNDVLEACAEKARLIAARWSQYGNGSMAEAAEAFAQGVDTIIQQQPATTPPSIPAEAPVSSIQGEYAGAEQEVGDAMKRMRELREKNFGIQ